MKSFCNYNGGHQTDDFTINIWIKLSLQKVKEGRTHYSFASGDTTVITLVYAKLIEITVANDSGRSKLSLNLPDELEFVPYARKILVTT